jgi:hypothetical protein
MDRIRDATADLVSIFRSSATKHEANTRAAVVMEQLTHEPAFLTAVLDRYIDDPRSLNRKNYPVIGIEIALNPWFGLVANCWIPLPGRETHIATKAIHHHGDLLLTTATLYGPGYEHWMFTLPEPTGRDDGTYTMELIESAPHPQHHVSFVDAWTAHTPLYPKSLSITLALWSRRFPTTWKDRAKRLPFVRGREAQLKKVVESLGLRKTMQLNVIESFDFHPEGDTFKVMPERKEFGLGPNEHHVCSLFHVLQETGNEHLSRTLRRQLDHGAAVEGRAAIERLLPDLEHGKPIEGRLSEGHYGLPYANFTRDDILCALRGASAGPRPTKEHHVEHDHAGAALRQEAAGARPR